MKFRLHLSLLMAMLLTLVMAVPAFAGGWAVITLDELPSGAVAGEPLTVGFAVRQHGRTLMTGLSPKVIATLGTEARLIFPAQAEGSPGHYTASMTLPKPGDWQWSIEAFTMYQPMPPLTVAAPATAADADESAARTGPIPTASLVPVGMAVLAFGLLAAVIALRRKSRPVMVLTAVCLLAGFALLAAGTGMGSGAQARAISESSSESSLSQVEFGRQLFVAKGCITCHSNSKVSGSSDYMTIGMGAPDLSRFSASPEALRLRLEDPTLVKSDTMMPNLELKELEIEALIAFINSK